MEHPRAIPRVGIVTSTAVGPKQLDRSTSDHLPQVVTGIRDSTLLGYPERLLLVSCGVGYSFGKGVAGRNLNFVNPPWG
jgi:hypothetical protein